MANKPLLIVMTPVRNEAWVLPAFLRATSLWADFIIVADQMSTDGSRELLKKCNKVILIDNNNPNFNEAERQSMLVTKAREVANGRDCILFGLDADEVFAANFDKTEDWQRLLHSRPGDVFWFKWAEISPDKKHFGDSVFYPWAFHDDGKEPHGNYVRNMHSMRIPYPIDEKQMFYVKDFRVLHFAYLNEYRVLSKCRFYKFVDWELNKREPIKLARSYNYIKKFVYDLPRDYLEFEWGNVLDLVDVAARSFWFDKYVVDRLGEHDKNDLAKLDIWDKQFMEQNGLPDPRSLKDKIIHEYIKETNRYKHKSKIIGFLDMCIGKIQ